MKLLLFSHQVVSDSLRPLGLQHARFLHPPLSPEVCSNSSPLSCWCYLTISSSVAPLFCHPESGSFPMPKYRSFSFSISPSNNIQDWFSSELTGLISLQSKGLSRVFFNTTVQKPSVLWLRSSSFQLFNMDCLC